MRIPDRLRRAGRAAMTALAIAAGIGLAAFLLREQGTARVLDLLEHAGWALAAACAVHLVQLVLAGAAWRRVTRRDGAPSLPAFVALRWLREGVNGMLPVLPIAGPLAGVRLLTRRGMALPDATAATITDTSVELVSQIGFMVIGLAVLVLARGTGAVTGWMAAALGGLCLAAALLLPSQWFGLGRLAERLARRLPWARGMTGLHDAIRATWHDRRRVAIATAEHLAAWLLGGLEVWLALHAFGDHAGLQTCLVIECLGGAIRTAAFMVPAAIGVQEGGLVLICGLFGIPPAHGLALSLFKRLREVAFGTPSLALWLFLERRAAPTTPRRATCPSART